MTAETKPGREPEAMVLVPRRITAEDGYKYVLSGEFFEEIEVPNPDYDEDDKDSDDTIRVRVPIQWTTIKEIHARIVRTAEICADRQAPAVPAPAGNRVREALLEARSGLCAYTGGVTGACSETIKRIDIALIALATPVSAEEDGLRAASFHTADDLETLREAVEQIDGNGYRNFASKARLALTAVQMSLERAALTPTPAESAPSGDTVAAPVAWRYRFEDTERWYVQRTKPSLEGPDVILEGLYPASTIEALQRERDRFMAGGNAATREAGALRTRIAELEASLAQDRSKREDAAQDERDRLYAKAQASNTANFLRQEGAMMPHERAARAARGERT